MTIEDQIKFCQEKRAEWEKSTGQGEVALMASKQINMYQGIEDSLKVLGLLRLSVDKMHADIYGVPEEKSKKTLTPEDRIKNKDKKGSRDTTE